MSELSGLGASLPQPLQPRGRKRWRLVAWALSILVVLTAVGSVALAIFVGWNLTHKPRQPITKTPAIHGLSFENVTFPSRVDQLKLLGWYIPVVIVPGGPPTSDKTVIIAHGYAGNRLQEESDALGLAQVLTSQGYNTLLFDFRGSGESEGTEITVGGRETRDLAGAVDFAKTRGAKKVALLGYSMGATTSLLVGERLPDVDAVIADSAFSALGPYLKENASHWTHLPDFPFTYVISWVLPKMLGMELKEVDARAEMDRLANRPLLLIHGLADDAIGPHHSKDLLAAYERAGGSRGQLWLVPGAKHTGSRKTAKQEYDQRVLDFLKDALK